MLKKKVAEPVEEVKDETVYMPLEEAVSEPVEDAPEPEEKPKNGEKFVDTECLNIRSKADGDVIGRLYRNTKVNVTSVKAGWARIDSPIVGYCRAEYLA